MAEISVIVPVYRVENYIRPCIDSILAQTFTDFELLLVDDGTDDRSGEICDAYAEKDARIRVLHQKNAGVASARNAGMAQASGDYLCFVDADDCIEPDMLAHCLAAMRENGADVLRHGHITELWQDGKCVSCEKNSAPAFTTALTHAEIAEQMERFWQNCSNYVWNYVFKKQVVENLRFPDIKISEDHIFVLRALENCQKICFLGEEPYHYCMRMGSSANRWEETGVDCQRAMLAACRHFMDSFCIAKERQDEWLAEITLRAYSYALYLLCFPACPWTAKQKREKLGALRRELEIPKRLAHADFKGLSAGDKLKRVLMRLGMEGVLLFLGPMFMRIVRKANG